MRADGALRTGLTPIAILVTKGREDFGVVLERAERSHPVILIEQYL